MGYGDKAYRHANPEVHGGDKENWTVSSPEVNKVRKEEYGKRLAVFNKKHELQKVSQLKNVGATYTIKKGDTLYSVFKDFFGMNDHTAFLVFANMLKGKINVDLWRAGDTVSLGADGKITGKRKGKDFEVVDALTARAESAKPAKKRTPGKRDAAAPAVVAPGLAPESAREPVAVGPPAAKSDRAPAVGPPAPRASAAEPPAPKPAPAEADPAALLAKRNEALSGLAAKMRESVGLDISYVPPENIAALRLIKAADYKDAALTDNDIVFKVHVAGSKIIGQDKTTNTEAVHLKNLYVQAPAKFLEADPKGKFTHAAVTAQVQFELGMSVVKVFIEESAKSTDGKGLSKAPKDAMVLASHTEIEEELKRIKASAAPLPEPAAPRPQPAPSAPEAAPEYSEDAGLRELLGKYPSILTRQPNPENVLRRGIHDTKTKVDAIPVGHTLLNLHVEDSKVTKVDAKDFAAPLKDFYFVVSLNTVNGKNAADATIGATLAWAKKGTGERPRGIYFDFPLETVPPPPPGAAPVRDRADSIDVEAEGAKPEAKREMTKEEKATYELFRASPLWRRVAEDGKGGRAYLYARGTKEAPLRILPGKIQLTIQGNKIKGGAPASASLIFDLPPGTILNPAEVDKAIEALKVDKGIR